MQLNEADARVRQELCSGPVWTGLTRLGIAVSGGGDSMALLHLLAACAPDHGVALEAASVDHGLRPEAADEAAFVAETCAGLGIPHEILRWQGWDGSGNLQAEARAARYRLLADWAKDRALDTVALGHTLDDQAETFLMRLAREAGVEGLAAMDTVFTRAGTQFWRPMLALERGELRAFLSRHGFAWRDDPSNDDPRFDRVRARKALALLEDLGISRSTLRGVALNMASANAVLRQNSGAAAQRFAQVSAGDVAFDRSALMYQPEETARRLVVAALNWVSGASYAPRRESLADLQDAIRQGKTHTLHGCIVLSDRGHVRICREHAAVKQAVAPLGQPWDSRWIVTGPNAPGLEIRALGEAVKDCPNWRETGLPRTSLLASPAVWRGDVLVAAPLAGSGNGYSAVIDPSLGDFVTSVLSH